MNPCQKVRRNLGVLRLGTASGAARVEVSPADALRDMQEWARKTTLKNNREVSG